MTLWKAIIGLVVKDMGLGELPFQIFFMKMEQKVEKLQVRELLQ